MNAMTPALDRRALLAALASAAIPRAAFAASGPDYPALKAFLDGYVSSGRLPGGVIAIKRGSTPVRYISAGALAFDTRTPVDEDTLWRIYSMTKPITGMAVMKLVEGGKLRLDQPLSDVLPDFKAMQVIADPKTMETRPAATPILIRHLLTHTAGFGYNFLPSPAGRLYDRNGIKPGERRTEPGPGELPQRVQQRRFPDRPDGPVLVPARPDPPRC